MSSEFCAAYSADGVVWTAFNDGIPSSAVQQTHIHASTEIILMELILQFQEELQDIMVE